MLKQRICGLVLVRFGVVVQSFQYERYLPIGRPEFSIRYLGAWGVDELILVDLTPGRELSDPDFALLRMAAALCLTPLTFAGRINSLEQACQAVQSGADKVSINSGVIREPELITQISRELGSQCCVVSVDVYRDGREFLVWDPVGRRPTEIRLADHLQLCEQLGTGEFIVSSIEHDGTGRGFDIEMAELAITTTRVPTIVSGGANTPHHVAELLSDSRVRGAAIGNRFAHTEHSAAVLKAALSPGIPVRQDSSFAYRPDTIDFSGRLLKADDEALEDMLFMKIEQEKI